MSRIKASEDLKKIVLLYLEDEESIRETFTLMIGKYFKKVYVALNGAEGLELFKKHNIDIIISDIQMPVMTGLEMAKEIKEIDYEIPIIFTTAFSDSEYLKQAIDIGVDGYIIKPIDRNKVIERLNIISKSIVAKKEISQYMRLIEILFNYQKNAVLLLDNDFNVKIYNKTFEKLLQKANIINPKNIKDIIIYCIDDETQNPISINDINKSINSKFTCKSTKSNIYYEISIEKVENYILININDITEYKLETEEIQEESMIDSLTGIYNRKKLEVMQKKLMNENICLVIFDIDDFKKINDTYGHLKGDEVLKTLTKVVKESLREADIIIRWGGEEFLLFLDGVKDINIAKNLAEKLRIKINEIEIAGVGHFSCSFGVACGVVTLHNKFEDILNKADEALYIAKRDGKNRVEIF